MSCPKCHGLEVVITYCDHETAIVMSRCVNCGRLSDPVMQRNKTSPLPQPWLDVNDARRPRHVRTGQASPYDLRREPRTGL